jgi:predicted component of type VI protein secretion system
MIISDKLFNDETRRLVATLEKYQSVIGYSLKDLNGISSSLCTHRIPMEQEHKPIHEHQRWLNNVLREVIKKEVLALLKARVIYPVVNGSIQYKWCRRRVVRLLSSMRKMNSFLSRLSPVG